MVNYKLLTPGPLTTSATVKAEMMVDHCTWDNDYKQITQKIREELLGLAHVDSQEYTAVLMQGSGTFGVESAITSSVGKDGKVLILSNGAYGERQEDICKHTGLKYRIIHFHYNEVPDAKIVEEMAGTGVVFSAIFMILQLIPIPGLNGVHFGKESYIMLVVWIALGIIFYIKQIKKIREY